MLSNFLGGKFDIVRACRALGRVGVANGPRSAMQRALPQVCVLCVGACGNAMICEACAAQMPTIIDACPRCALPSPDNLVCGACLAKPPPLDATIAAWCYAFPADRLLHAFKYGGRLALAEPLAQALAGAVRARHVTMPDRLIAMPLSAARQRERGFNQAHEIARHLSRQVRVAVKGELRRVRDTSPQAGLTLRERTRNVRGAFAAGDALAGQHVAIIDDVMTTGATLHAAAIAIRNAGATRVDAWVVARTVKAHGSGIGGPDRHDERPSIAY
jgi:ComF family protein